MSPRFGPLLLAVIALLGTATTAAAVASAGGGVAPDAGPAPASVGTAPVGAEEPIAVNATYEVQLRPNGDARWTVTVWETLEDDAARSAYRDLAERFESGETSDLGLEAFRSWSSAAGRSTGRSMDVREVRRSTSPPSEIANGSGRLSISFTWTNFANATGNGTLAVGDVFRTDDGRWFSSLTANQRLTISPPEGYSVFETHPESTARLADGQLRWEGPETFEPEAMSARFTGERPDTEPPNGETSVTEIVAALVVVLVVVLLVMLLWRRREWFGTLTGDGASDGSEEVAGGSDAGRAPPDAADLAEPEDDVDVELLSDEERVERLLDRNGGRMKQATIVKETGWSNAKVSQLLSSMAEEDRIDKLRIGRENLISFPDEDVADVEE